MRRGITLIELLVALAISAMLIVALGSAFSAAIRFDRASASSGIAEARVAQFEDALRTRISAAMVSDDAADANTYFIGRAMGDDGSVGTDPQANELVFTVAGKRLPSAAIDNTDTDFEARNVTLGPVGGVTELSISTTPVGDAGDLSGLFLREQTPSDEDPDQGGYESLLTGDVTSIGYEFFDGTDWVSTWDTRDGDRRLPAAVRVSYSLSGDDESSGRVFVIRLRNSDVTPQSPAGAALAGGNP